MAKRDVACYAGAGYPERPRDFVYRGQRVEVVDVERREQTPRRLRFAVRAGDGRRFWLGYDKVHDAWDIRLIQRPSKRPESP